MNKIFPLFGIFSTENFEKWLNEKLSSRLFPGENIRNVCFVDVPVPLTIITTDLNSKKIVTFNKTEHPNFSVAKAVAASISIPGAFKPLLYKNMVLVDGGMLSNFPAWSLDNEAEGQAGIVPTFGFRLNNDSSNNTSNNFPVTKRKTLLNYAVALLRTAFLGENILEARQVLDLSQIPLKVSISTLDFDLSYEKKCELYAEGKFWAERFYRYEYIGPKDPRDINDVFQFLEKEVLRLIKKSVNHLRINLALPIEPNRKKLRILYPYKMETDMDDRLVLGLEEGAIGRCWQQQDNVLVDMADARETFATKWKMTKYQQALVRSDLKTLISIPIFEWEGLDTVALNKENEMLAVLSIDSNEDLLEEFVPLSEKDIESDLWQVVNLASKEIAEALRK